jgi:hypothetical protein
MLDQLAQYLAGGSAAHDRAQRQDHHPVGAVCAILARAHPVLAPPGLVVLAVARVLKRRPAFVGLQDDRAAAAAIAPVRTPARDVSLPAERDAAAAAVAGMHLDLALIDEVRGSHGRILVPCAGADCCAALATGQVRAELAKGPALPEGSIGLPGATPGAAAQPAGAGEEASLSMEA